MEFALDTLSQLMNQLLKLDPEMGQRLAPFTGKCIEIESTQLPFKFYLELNQDGVQIKSQTKQIPSAKIKGSLFSLGALAIKDSAQSKSLFSNEVEFSGDLEYAQAVKQAFDQLDIDWAELLSKIVGDAMSHEISSVFSSLNQKAQQLSRELQLDVKEYLTEEVRLTPHQLELEAFYQDISTLREDVERTELRLKQLLRSHD